MGGVAVKPEIERELRELLERAMYGADVRASFIMHLDRVRKAMRDALMLGTMLEQRHRNEQLANVGRDAERAYVEATIAGLQGASPRWTAHTPAPTSPKCSDCEIFAPQEDGRCWACAGREAKRPDQIYALTMGAGLGDNGVCSVCLWHCAGEVGVALQTPNEVPAGYRAPAICLMCVRFISRLGARLALVTGPTQNPLPADPPQVPENTPAAEPPADPTQNDPIASGCSWCGHRLGHHVRTEEGLLCWCGCWCGSRGGAEAVAAAELEIGIPQTATNILAREAAEAAGAELGREIGQTAVAAAEAAEKAGPLSDGASFNHTRGDGPFDPCPLCLTRMTPRQLSALREHERKAGR